MNDEGPALAGLGVPTMVERVARAIYAERNRHSRKSGPWDGCPPHLLEGYIAEARAAIESMREPTDEMCERVRGRFMALPPAARNCWEEMIDAALSSSER
jgi:hypothetical protein